MSLEVIYAKSLDEPHSSQITVGNAGPPDFLRDLYFNLFLTLHPLFEDECAQ